MTVAIFGLLGVFVGGVLNGIVALGVDRARARQDGRAAALLVAEDLIYSIAPLLAVRTAKSWRPLLDPRYGQRDSWDEHKPALNHVLTVKQWQTLSATFAVIERTARAAQAHRATPSTSLTDTEGREVARAYILACMATSILGHVVSRPRRLRVNARRDADHRQAAEIAKLSRTEMELRDSRDWVSPLDASLAPHD